MTGSELSCRELLKAVQVPVAESQYWHILLSETEWRRRDLVRWVMAFMPYLAGTCGA